MNYLGFVKEFEYSLFLSEFLAPTNPGPTYNSKGLKLKIITVSKYYFQINILLHHIIDSVSIWIPETVFDNIKSIFTFLESFFVMLTILLFELEVRGTRRKKK